MYEIHQGKIGRGFQLASGLAVHRADNPSPFSDGTLKLQAPHFLRAGFDLEVEVPDLFWGTVNIELPYDLVLASPDTTLTRIDWAATEPDPAMRVQPEDFSFVRCCLAVDGRYHLGLIYYPHPETKPSTNEHNHAVLEVLSRRIEGLTSGQPAAVICRSDAFKVRG